MKIHDSGYGTLFRNRTIFRQLVETFVKEPWVAELDFAQAETVETTFIDEDYRQTESDLIYRLKLRDKEVYFYILMEFQSTVDYWMVLRIAHYVTSLYMSLVKERKRARKAEKAAGGQPARKQEKQQIKLPAVFPLLLYNGDDKWTAPTDLSVLIEDVPNLGQYGIQCRYWKIAENEIAQERLLEIRNIVSTLFLAEAHYDIELLIKELLRLFQTEEDRQAVSLLINWFRQLAVHGRIESDDFGKVAETYRSVEEAKSMLISAIEKEREDIREEGRKEGREEGREEGCAAMQFTIEEVLKRRFKDVSNEIRTSLTKCNLEQLQALINPALDAPDLDAFLPHIPKRDAEDEEIGIDEADNPSDDDGDIAETLNGTAN